METIKIIARIRSDFPEKFGIPRQSGVVPETRAEIVFEKPYQNPDALRGVEGFSHLWLIWGFSACERDAWSPTVRPPRLGGNARMGVFATRSPFRPNPIGLSSVTLEEVRLHTPEGPVLVVGGADLMDGTPIYDIKPYLPYADCHPEATGGFAEEKRHYALTVDLSGGAGGADRRRRTGRRCAACWRTTRDPRTRAIPERVYGVAFAGKNVRFTVEDGVLTVRKIEEI